ncbi:MULTISPECIES: hypothetical protein [Clostridium]|uniref:hypothetical protein n=1 Tax=Clostridium TaxID=1485 RepID=UPI002330D11C|nr:MULTISPECIES: hypothetical protein [Clostridium]MDB2104828.1 hypothetical protein [Clostridium paraputrificum]MDU2108706.1 hypothetical protein [Clostridium sp.]MDU3355183.1 hypothetical protein [Clostridium sp.]MDU4727959.1 hypothetical protein [Clostridium sp.]
MDVIQQLANLGNEFIQWMQILGIPAAGIAFGVGGFLQIFGGAEGLRKAKPWYIGAGVGLVFIIGASAIASFLETKITF